MNWFLCINRPLAPRKEAVLFYYRLTPVFIKPDEGTHLPWVSNNMKTSQYELGLTTSSL